MDRHAERARGAIVSGVDGFQMLEQMTAGIPRRATAARADVVAVAGGDRDGLDVLEAEWRGKVQEAVGDPLENGAVEFDQIDLVHRQDGVANAQQADDDGVTPRLGEKALARIDQKHRQFGRGRAGRHVAGILLVARGVGDNERPPSGREIAIGDVDGDALFALGLQPIEQQGKIDLRSAGAVFAGIALERGQMILENEVLLVEQPAEQGRFAIVDRAAGEEPQRRALSGVVEPRGRVEGDGFRAAHQK